MSDLFERLSHLFERSRDVGFAGIRDDREWAPETLRDAAVLMAVTDRPEPGILLTHRPDTMPSHPGQVAFPGGKLEAGEDAIAAALREAEEELAIDPAKVRIVGSAPPFVTGSGYTLTAVLGLIPPDLPIRPDPREVADWFEAPLRFVLDQRNHVEKTGMFGETELPYYEIEWEGHRIWGITAGIIANLSHRLAWEDLAGGRGEG
ncbi:CoA pyrophosphatase [Aurantiacibacter spongiae]|uniref:CoA pyrophosphatase n=1 Tax=Aurantiacibacter spongiae TaxID=2488860 RepID=A0A3N5CVI3_9SPHN|nr:CoA pyrophosphatase [Aurantiacibacter spongiae]RPF72356.1 CoA pyrophosphatase [Aurantiacibacter spongiae]